MVFRTDRLALTRLRAIGVRTVGLDLLLSVSPERWLSTLGGDLKDAARAYDQPFRSELNRGQVVLAATQSGAGEGDRTTCGPVPITCWRCRTSTWPTPATA